MLLTHCTVLQEYSSIHTSNLFSRFATFTWGKAGNSRSDSWLSTRFTRDLRRLRLRGCSWGSTSGCFWFCSFALETTWKITMLQLLIWKLLNKLIRTWTRVKREMLLKSKDKTCIRIEYYERNICWHALDQYLTNICKIFAKDCHYWRTKFTTKDCHHQRNEIYLEIW
jgi:hypothetical protein